MINLVRIDGRLIHGMVAVSWVGAENPDTLVIVNDRAANDEFEKMTLKLAKPGGVDMFVWTKEKAVERLNSSKYANKKIFLVVGNFEDALFVFDNVPDIKRLNVGPTLDEKGGRVTEGKLEFSNIWISAEEFKILKKIHDKGVEIFAQVSPTVGRSEYSEIAGKFK